MPLSINELERRERQITVQYKHPEVSEAEIALVESMYTQGIPLIKITRRLQSQRSHSRKQPLIYMDLYSILYVSLTNRRIVQRSLPEQEFSINDFAAFFRRWKACGTYEACCAEIKDRPLEYVQDFARNVFRSIGDRFRREKAELFSNTTAAVVLSTGNSFDQSILKHACRRRLRETVEGRAVEREAIVIFLEDLPVEFAGKLKAMPNSLVYEKGIQSGQDFFELLTKASPHQEDQPAQASSPKVPAHKPAARSRTTDSPFSPPPPPLPPPAPPVNINDDLSILDPHEQALAKVKEQDEIRLLEKQANKRLHQQSKEVAPPVLVAPPPLSDDDELEQLLAQNSQMDSLSLENLSDDDPV